MRFRKAIKSLWDFPDAVLRIVDKVFPTNGYLAYPKNILISMLTDLRPNIRKLAVRRIEGFKMLENV